MRYAPESGGRQPSGVAEMSIFPPFSDMIPKLRPAHSLRRRTILG